MNGNLLRPPTHRSTPEELHLAECRLVVVKGPQRGREYVGTGDVIRVGKAPDNDFVLTDETVSRVHLEILRDPKGYLVRDLHSTNGTFLDGAEIREAYVRPGAILTVGAVQLQFHASEERFEVRPTEAEELGELYGRSRAMREVFSLLERIAPTDVNLLVQGEPGTGKELVARTVHARSRRAKGPLVTVDCRALTGPALERVLLGHEKGAFPGAMAARPGALEAAHGGTVLLDHVGDLGLDLQSRLQRMLEQREVRRLGGNRTVKVDLRFVAASERDLAEEVERGRFREDLYARLAVAPVRLPPLRERPEDIPGLVERFRRALAAAGSDGGGALDEAQVTALAAHDWPGNVRELRLVIERGLGRSFAALGSGAVRRSPEGEEEFDPALSYRETKERWEWDFERRYLGWLLGRAGGNISRASREAEMDRKYLHKLLRKHRMVD